MRMKKTRFNFGSAVSRTLGSPPPHAKKARGQYDGAVQKVRCNRRLFWGMHHKACAGAKVLLQQAVGFLSYDAKHTRDGAKKSAATSGFLWMGRNAHAAQKVSSRQAASCGWGAAHMWRKSFAAAQAADFFYTARNTRGCAWALRRFFPLRHGRTHQRMPARFLRRRRISAAIAPSGT